MDNKKFEQLIELIINEDEEKARALFHDIVVEKSRQIYEGLMDEEMGMEGMGNHDEVGGLLDEIDVEENGMTEEEDEFADIPSDDEESHEVDLDPDAMGDEEGEGNIEDRVVDLEDKLDELMAEFEAMMGHEGGEEGHEDMGGEEFGGEEDMMEGEQPEWLKKKKDSKKDDKDDKDDEDDEKDEDEDEDKEKEQTGEEKIKN